MNVKDYIINKLEDFVGQFPNSRVRYENDKMALVHTIEISPKEIYNSNNDYIEWEDKFFDDFIDKYPTENICFITEGDLMGIKDVCFEKMGFSYKNYNNVLTDVIATNFTYQTIDSNIFISQQNDDVQDNNEINIQEVISFGDYQQSNYITKAA